MITVDEAINIVLANAGTQQTTSAPLSAVLGKVLAENVTSDVDSPPFDKSLMDGFAVTHEDGIKGEMILEKVGEILAGQSANHPLSAGKTLQIMTGAPIPPGADGVVVVEKSEFLSPTQVKLRDAVYKAGQNIMKRGEELRLGDVVLRAGELIGPAELGVLATVGKTDPVVYRTPSIAIISTGDEIVPASQKPSGAQIRNSNESILLGLIQRAGCVPIPLGIARDDTNHLTELVTQGLNADVLLLTGGVSAGKKDFVPAVLESLGVKKHFQGVAFKPGKPVWFGEHSGGLVFGLPGNPVSVLACFELFVRTALRARQKFSTPGPSYRWGRLTGTYEYRASRLTYHPAKIDEHGEIATVEPVAWFGSPDMKSLTQSNGFVILPIQSEPFRKGDPVQFIPLDRTVR